MHVLHSLSTDYFISQEYGRIIAKKAAGDDVFERYRRVQIVNLWRPLQGQLLSSSDIRVYFD